MGQPQRNAARIAPVTRTGPFGPRSRVCQGNSPGAGSPHANGPNGPPGAGMLAAETNRPSKPPIIPTLNGKSGFSPSPGSPESRRWRNGSRRCVAPVPGTPITLPRTLPMRLLRRPTEFPLRRVSRRLSLRSVRPAPRGSPTHLSRVGPSGPGSPGHNRRVLPVRARRQDHAPAPGPEPRGPTLP